MGEKILNLPMRKEFALEILRGDKVREYRTTSQHWARILGVLGKNERGVTEIQAVKQFDVVHFYPYNNKWHLDCKVRKVVVVKIDEEFQELYGHEYQAELGEFVFVIVLGDVISTNLVLDEEG